MGLSPFPHLFPPPLGPSAPRVEADILTRSSPLLSPNTSRQLPPRGPSSFVPGQGLHRFLWWEEVHPSGNTVATPGSLFGPLWSRSARDGVPGGALCGRETPAAFCWLSFSTQHLCSDLEPAGEAPSCGGGAGLGDGLGVQGQQGTSRLHAEYQRI